MYELTPLSGNVTLLPPPVATGASASVVNGANPCVVPGGRTYSAAPGSTVVAPAGDAAILINNGWSPVAWGSGTTAQRPTGSSVAPGMHWYDTTVGAIIVYDGVTWRSPTGAAV